VRRVDTRTAGRLRRAFGRGANAKTLARAFGELLTSDVAISVRKVGVAPFDGTGHAVGLEAVSGARVVVEPEPALVTLALARLLGRAVPPTPTDPRAALEPALAGALAALFIEGARRAGTLLEFHATRGAPASAEGLRMDVTVRLDEKPYSSTLWLFAQSSPTTGNRTPELALLGDFPITVPLVAAVSEGARTEVESLRRGDVWLPGAGWLCLANGGASREATASAILRRACLASPTMERGVEAGRSEDGRIVVRPNLVALGAEPRFPPGAHRERNQAMSEPDETLREIALEAPLVVRVEVASITLTAREWADLGPGDVIETGVPIAEPVVLRVAGREVARGELVTVDGELGVRIREIVDPGRSP
jgi:flagellar motor switch/type III secretory pathway protein FliN